MISNQNTLGERARCCAWVLMSNGTYQYVCRGCGGAANLQPGALLGNEADLIATYMRDLADSKAQVTYYQAEVARYPESAEARSRLNYWMARVASIEYLLSKGVAYIRQQGSQSYNTGGDLVAKNMQRFLQSLNKLNDNSMLDNTNGIIDDLQDTLTTQYAGFPLWAIIGIGGAAAWFIFDKKKTARR